MDQSRFSLSGRSISTEFTTHYNTVAFSAWTDRCVRGVFWLLVREIPSEFVPKEDRNNFFILMQAEQGASFNSNARNLAKLEAILLPYIDSGEVNRVLVRTPGFGSSAGIAIVGTVPHDEKSRDTFALMREISGQLSQLPDVRAFAIMRSGIGGRGASRPVQFVLQGNTYEELSRMSNIVLQKARQNPGLVRVTH